MKKLVVWDFNGTILDDKHLCFEIENEMLTSRGMRPISDIDEYLDIFFFPIRDYYRELGYDFEKESYESLADEYIEKYLAGFLSCPLKEGVIEAFELLKARGIAQTILSMTRQDRLLEQTESFGIRGYFQEILGLTDDLADSKVDRAVRYIEAHGIDRKEVLFIGDTEHDADVARAAGCDCVLITQGHQSRRILEKCGIPVMDSYRELPQYLN